MAATFIPTGLGREREPSDKESRLMGELRRLADKCAKENTVLSSIEHAAIARLYTKKGLALKPEEVRVVFAMAMERKASGRDDGSSNNPCVVYDCEEAIRQKAKIAMSVYDANKDGKVSKKEMAAVSGSRLSSEDIDRAFAAHDANGDGHLDLAELEAMMRAAGDAGERVKSQLEEEKRRRPKREVRRRGRFI